MRHYLAKMLPGPILTVSTRVSRYQVQSKTSLHLTSRLPRAWHLPFCPKDECAIFRVHDGKNMSPSLGGSPFKFLEVELSPFDFEDKFLSPRSELPITIQHTP